MPEPGSPPSPHSDGSSPESDAAPLSGSDVGVRPKRDRVTMRCGYKVGARGPYLWIWRFGRTWVLRSRPAVARHKEDGPGKAWKQTLTLPFEVSRLLRELDHAALVDAGSKKVQSFPALERPLRSPHATRRREAVRRFFADVPLDVQHAIKDRFDAGTWPLFRLLLTCDPARELMATEDGARLGWLLANLHDLVSAPDLLRRARRWARLGRREILGRVGFPATAAALSALSKVPREDMSVWNIKPLQAALATPALWDRLRHLPQITSVVLDLTTAPRLLSLLAPSFLLELAREPPRRHRDASSLRYLLSETVDMLERQDQRVPLFTSVAQLREHHDRALRRTPVEHQLSQEPFPPLPIELTPEEQDLVVPLRTSEALAAEGVTMEHCLGRGTMHHALARLGHFHAFQILKPERLTLAVIWAFGRWSIYDLQGPGNTPTEHPEARELAAKILARFCAVNACPKWTLASNDNLAELPF